MFRVVSVLLPFTASASAVAPAGPMALSVMGKEPRDRNSIHQCSNDIAHTGDKGYAFARLQVMIRDVRLLVAFTASAIAVAPAGPMALPTYWTHDMEGIL